MTSIRVCLITILLTIVYLFASVGISNLFLYQKANGSLIKSSNRIVGSRLLGQNFTKDIYFQGRPSLYNYKNNISGNSNYSYFSNDLSSQTLKNYHLFIEKDNNKPDLNIISESASGLDPHITYLGALSQTSRIGSLRNLKRETITSIIEKNAMPSIFGLFGQKIVNVLELNLELDEINVKTSRTR